MFSTGYLLKIIGIALITASYLAFDHGKSSFEYSLMWLVVGGLVIFLGLVFDEPKPRPGTWTNPDSYYIRKSSETGFKYYGKRRLIVIFAAPIGFLTWWLLPVALPVLQQYAQVIFDTGRL